MGVQQRLSVVVPKTGRVRSTADSRPSAAASLLVFGPKADLSN